MFTMCDMYNMDDTTSKINVEKLEICINTLNQYIHKYYDKYELIDRYTFSEFTSCSFEEKDLLCETISTLLHVFTHKLNETIIYWTAIYYYYNTIVLEYNVLSIFNQHNLKRYIKNVLVPGLHKKGDHIQIEKIKSIEFTNIDIIKVTELMLRIACSDEKWASYIRKKLKPKIV